MDGTTPPAIPSDAALVEAARQGQAWAHEALFRRHARMASGLAYRLLAGSDVQADDVVQDAFVTAFERLNTLRAPEAFPSWLGSIVVRYCSKRLRRHRLRLRFGLARKEEVDIDLSISPDAPPDVTAALKEAYILLDRLKPEERMVFLLRRVEGLTVPEIADQLKTSISTVKRRMQSGEERVQRALFTSRRGSPPSTPPIAGEDPRWEDVS